MYFVLEPEVAGGIGESTVLDSTVHPPTVSNLEYKFDGWLGDDILEAFPCFIVAQRLATALQQTTMSGYVLDDVTITKSEVFNELYPSRELPEFRWIKVHGRAGEDDFGLAADHRLVVSESAFNLLKRFSIQNCEFEEYSR